MSPSRGTSTIVMLYRAGSGSKSEPNEQNIDVLPQPPSEVDGPHA